MCWFIFTNTLCDCSFLLVCVCVCVQQVFASLCGTNLALTEFTDTIRSSFPVYERATSLNLAPLPCTYLLQPSIFHSR